MFRKIQEALNPGGIFVNVDQIKGPSAFFEKFYWDQWLQKVRKADADEEQIAKSIDRRITYDIDSTLADQLLWLREAGFAEVDLLYKYYFLGVFWAQKDQ